MLKMELIALLNEVKSKINKSEVCTIEKIEEAITKIEKMQKNTPDKTTLLMLTINNVIMHLPSIEIFIRSFYSS